MSDMSWVHSDASFQRIVSESEIKIYNSASIEELFMQYGHKFYRAGYLTAKYMVECGDISKLDTYFFALVYLYRHSLELILKAIAFQFIIEREERIEFLKNTFHNLAKIFAVVKPFINLQNRFSKDVIIWLEQYLDGISWVDKESDSFRYPFNISITSNEWGDKQYRAKPLFEKQTHINLIALANKMEIAYSFLECVYNKVPYNSNEHIRYTTEFLQEGGSYHGQCVVGYGYAIGKFFPFIKAYSEIPSMLVAEIVSGKESSDILFLPVCYLYRNAVELALKGILYEESLHSRQESLRLICRYKHKISGLWQSIRKQIIEEAGVPENDKTVLYVDEYISQLHSYDPSSSIFRYPIDKHLAYHFKNTRVLDIENVDNFFRELISFLEAVDTMLSAHNEWRAEMEAELRSNMDWDY